MRWYLFIASLFWMLPGFGQQIKNASWSEQLWVHTDRTVYLTGEHIWFSLYCLDPMSGSLSAKSKLAYVELIDQTKKPVYQEILVLAGGRGAGQLTIGQQLPSGWYEFRSYTGWMKSGSEKTYYKKNLLLINPTTEQKTDSIIHTQNQVQVVGANDRTTRQLEHHFDQPVYEPRQLVQMELELPWKNNTTALSVSIVPADELEEMQVPVSANNGAALAGGAEGIPELEGPLVKARLINSRTGEAVPNATGLLTKPGKEFTIASSITNARGEWWFNPGIHIQPGELMVQTYPLSASGNEMKIEIMPLFSPVEEVQLPAMVSFNPTQWELIRKRYVNLQLANAYSILKDSMLNAASRTDTMPFGKPDNRYRLDDFTRFLTMEEIFREYITEVRVRKQDTAYFFRVRNKWMPGFFETEPLILLDGMLVNDTRDLMKLNPLDIAQIEVFTQKVFIGEIVKEGLIICRTYKGKADNIPVPLQAITIPYPGIQPKRWTLWPAYTEKNRADSRLPDRRNLIYWNPSLDNSINNGKLSVKFYHSDQLGRFKLTVRGFGPALEPVNFSTYFEVR